MILSKLYDGTKKVLNLTSPFYVPFYMVFEISRSLTYHVKNDVSRVLSSLFILGGVIVGMFLGGYRMVIHGAFAGLKTAKILTEISEVENFTEKLLGSLPSASRRAVLYFCHAFLTPFRSLSDMFEEMQKISSSYLNHPRFENVMELNKLMALYYLFIAFDPTKAENALKRPTDFTFLHKFFGIYNSKL